MKVVIEFCDAPMEIIPFVSKPAFIVAELGDLAKREESSKVLVVVVTLMFYVAWEFTFP